MPIDLIDAECRKCGRKFQRSPSSRERRCYRCANGRPAADHRWIRERERICHACEHWGDHQRGDATFTGCDLFAKPCAVEHDRIRPESTGPRNCWPKHQR